MKPKPHTPAFEPCRRPWCMRRDVYHRQPVECASVEYMAAVMDSIFGDGR